VDDATLGPEAPDRVWLVNFGIERIRAALNVTVITDVNHDAISHDHDAHRLITFRAGRWVAHRRAGSFCHPEIVQTLDGGRQAEGTDKGASTARSAERERFNQR
jgi:hypothetical protein